MLIPGKPMSASRVIGIVWVDFVENILVVNKNRLWGFIDDFPGL